MSKANGSNKPIRMIDLDVVRTIDAEDGHVWLCEKCGFADRSGVTMAQHVTHRHSDGAWLRIVEGCSTSWHDESKARVPKLYVKNGMLYVQDGEANKAIDVKAAGEIMEAAIQWSTADDRANQYADLVASIERGDELSEQCERALEEFARACEAESRALAKLMALAHQARNGRKAEP